MENKIKIDILPKQQKLLFDFLCQQAWLRDFYLAGGTALALQMGHRQSVDFDFFTQGEFDTKKLINRLNGFGKYELFSEAKNTLHGIVKGVQISFFKLEDKIVGQALMHANFNIANKADIGAMKLNAISGRGSKKDFIDLYFILKELSLQKLFKIYEAKYGKGVSNNYHLLKSLVYFEDAEKQPMPKMLVRVKWSDIKKNIVSHVKKAVF